MQPPKTSHGAIVSAAVFGVLTAIGTMLCVACGWMLVSALFQAGTKEPSPGSASFPMFMVVILLFVLALLIPVTILFYRLTRRFYRRYHTHVAPERQ